MVTPVNSSTQPHAVQQQASVQPKPKPQPPAQVQDKVTFSSDKGGDGDSR